jgi:hypothetical protein
VEVPSLSSQDFDLGTKRATTFLCKKDAQTLSTREGEKKSKKQMNEEKKSVGI